MGAQHQDPLGPVSIVKRIVADRGQSLVVVQPVSTEPFELIKEQAGRCGIFRTILGFPFQKHQRDFHRESARLLFGLFHQVSLERREIMRQLVHRRKHLPGMLQLGQQIFDRHRKTSGRQQLVVDLLEQFLHRHFLAGPLPKQLEQIALFDVLGAVELVGPGRHRVTDDKKEEKLA